MTTHKVLGFCPVHPEATAPCRCCKSNITTGDLYAAKPVGMALWTCENSHQEIGPPLMYTNNRLARCGVCGEKLYHVVSGVFQMEDR